MNKKCRIDALKRVCNERLIAIKINLVIALGILHVISLIKVEIRTLEMSQTK